MAYFNDHRSMMASAKTYNKVISELKKAWLEAFGDELVVRGSAPTSRFESMVDELRRRWAHREDKERLIVALDLDGGSDEKKSVEDFIDKLANDNVVRSVDDLTANQIFSAIYAVAFECGSQDALVELELDEFLRRVVHRIFDDNKIKGRINIGPNRHFPRLFQWLREYASGTEWNDGIGLKIRNLSGRGRVAQYPTDPKLLKVVIDRGYL
ncbi:hypothetical protein E0H71_00285 [Rhizobium leguminosarum bv. viciae]|uniref:hypothetical protein n=1 Tax=Rhizobium leguminosarum TaxID=384 RepID=UPI001040B716|nr:hypothetical protein [Rhizobium leguminosarum]TCA58074.1 hypothetical protein E0H71_00285 [Rhizobium leguminosarum bv. viciae]